MKTPANNSMDVRARTATLFVGLAIELEVAWRRFRPTSSQPLGADC